MKMIGRKKITRHSAKWDSAKWHSAKRDSAKREDTSSLAVMPLLRIKWSLLLRTPQQRLSMLFNGPDNPKIAPSRGDLHPV